ncbi:MAG: IclR family transcriptional regulator [Clostridiales bacterium]|nr:IclR family transcriptional regulator [Clostridiales bacterium]
MGRKEERMIRSEASSRSSNRMLQIMECLSENILPMRLQDIANQLEMSQSTVLRYINALIGSGYAYQEERTLRYSLTLKIAKLGYRVGSFMGVKSIASPFLTDITKRMSVSCCLVIEEDGKIVYLDVVNNPHLLRGMLTRIGREAPMSCTGSGKVFLSTYSDFRFRNYVAAGLQRVTEHSIVEEAALHEEIQKVREQGFAIDDQECELGIRCVSVPLYDYKNQVAAALSIFSAIDELPNSRIRDEILPCLNETSQIISLRLGSDVVPTYDAKYLEGE